MGTTQRVAPFLDWLRAATIDLLQGIAALTGVELSDANMAQRQSISKILVPPLSPYQPQSQHVPLRQLF